VHYHVHMKQSPVVLKSTVKQKKPVADAKGSLKKSVDALAIVPTKQRISILARKVYNVMMHFAQQQGEERQIYRVRLRDVVKGIDFGSHNTEVLKEHLRQMVTTKVEWQSPTKGEGVKWAVSALIAHAELISENGEVFMEWSYAANIKQQILDPQRYALISLNFQAEFRSIAGLALYEICSRYVENPAGLTARQHWTWWRPVLTGAPESEVDTYLQYKYFKRDVLKGAVAEVNQITDLEVELIEHKRGRGIWDLQFKVKRREQPRWSSEKIPTPVNLKDIGRAIQAGVAQHKAEQLLAKFGEEKFTQAVDALVLRHARNDLSDVRTPDKYLAATLATIQSVVTKAAGVVQMGKLRAQITSERVAMIERFREEKRKAAQGLYKESPEADQKQILSQFESEALPVIGIAVTHAYQKRGLDSPMTRSHFAKFLAEHFFGKAWELPSDSDLLDFTISGGQSV
jgi:Initiator Replication protein